MAVIVTGLLFDPLKRTIQARVDRVFDQKRFDYRETLVEFGRELNAQTDLATLVASIVERLPQTLLVNRVAVFPRRRASRAFFRPAALYAGSLARTYALGPPLRLVSTSTSSTFDGRSARNHIFFDSPQAMMRLPAKQREAGHRSGPELLPALPRRAARERWPAHDRRHRPGPHGRWRFPFLGRCRAARIAGWLYRYRHPECAALPVAAAKNHRLRTPQGLQRKHRRIDQCRRVCGRSRRPDR